MSLDDMNKDAGGTGEKTTEELAQATTEYIDRQMDKVLTPEEAVEALINAVNVAEGEDSMHGDLFYEGIYLNSLRDAAEKAQEYLNAVRAGATRLDLMGDIGYGMPTSFCDTIHELVDLEKSEEVEQ